MLGEWRLMGFGWVGVFGFGEVGPSGYEMCLKRLCNLVKSRVLADISIKIGGNDF